MPAIQNALSIKWFVWLCRCVYVEHNVLKGLDWTAEIPGYRDKIDEVGARYEAEGMPSEAEGSPQNAYDLAIIINRHTVPSNILVCP